MTVVAGSVVGVSRVVDDQGYSVVVSAVVVVFSVDVVIGCLVDVSPVSVDVI